MCASGLRVHRSRRQRVLQPALQRRRSRGRDVVRLRTSGLRAYRVARRSWKLTPLRFPKVRSCKKIGWQAEAPAPQKHKPLRANVGQTLSSVNPAISAIPGSLNGTATARRGVALHRWQDHRCYCYGARARRSSIQKSGAKRANPTSALLKTDY